MKVKQAIFCAIVVSALLTSLACRVATAEPRDQTVSVLMLSDLHFDPFHDPGKFAALRDADVSDWARIFITPPSSTQQQDFASLQKTCHARGEDSSWAVLNGSLDAARIEQPKPLFVTVSGDLLTHNFECRMKTLLPSATAEDIAKFAEKTIAFIALELRETFPGVRVYLALGNNDSGCADYHESPGSDFVHSAAASAAADFAKPREQQAVLRAFSKRGDYSVILPEPMRGTRLIILQDIFESRQYQDCDGNARQEQPAAQIAWLRAQLLAARKNHENVWVMAHIPPGIDEFAAFHKYTAHPEQLCQMTEPTPMLTSDALANTLTEFADVVRLALFAHTHMDEIKSLHSQSGATVAAKLVPSISPVNGNNPAFTIAEVFPSTATLMDYTVFVAGDKTASSWSQEYRYSTAYKMKDFSAASVAQLSASLANDRRGTANDSATYQKWYFPGDNGAYARGLRQIWPSYACATTEEGGAAFHDCMCPATVQQNGNATGQQ